MCGIIGYVGEQSAAPVLLDGLARLEYRGYDSSGIAVLEDGKGIYVNKRVGKLQELVSSLNGSFPGGGIGIGHTRWATHGKPSDANAHPHTDCSGRVVVIHNGIVENYLPLKRALLESGHRFISETDTEVIAHLVEDNLAAGDDLSGALRRACARLEGSQAILVMSAAEPGRIVAARLGNAGGIVIGYGKAEMFLAIDLPAILPHTRSVAFLADREMATVTATGAEFSDVDGNAIEKRAQSLPYDPVAAAKGPYKHFELKEIMEQPESLSNTIRGRAQFEPPDVVLEDVHFSPAELQSISRVVLLGMGSSMHAAMVGRHYIERIAGLPAEVDNSSEYRYRQPLIGPDTLVVSVTQSGETVDTLVAMAEAKTKGAKQITVCNTIGGQSTRIADGVIYTRCGPEIAVASTKTFTASISALFLLACRLGLQRGTLAPEEMESHLLDLMRLPTQVGSLLDKADEFERLAQHFHRRHNFLFLGRGINYPIALEGALKLKELSYIHAEGYPAGEMKHGPIALIDEEMPVVCIAPRDSLYEKMLSQMEQVKARDGIVIAVATEGDTEAARRADFVISLPPASEFFNPVLAAVPLQFLAYFIAVHRGYDVDQPRNLAKTVTVE
jgi:glucosamine--fructose-6-phosphate aminotransferase (isomerizing)